MKPKITISLFIALIIFVGISCKKDKTYNYKDLRTKGFINLNNDEKAFMKDHLITELKQDPDYKKLNNRLREVTKAWMGRAKSLDIHPPKSHSKTIQEKLDYYKSRGITNPEHYMTRYIQMIYYAAVIKKRYPELYQMTKKDRKSIMDAAEPTVISMNDVKEITETIKNNQNNLK